ncbi:hypothetical protein [Gordonia paraffinivorans]|uniref:Uncharacterized protein n=1 Tax=Gordonia paraffinivorans NBRC 108238 TaxID=1223543 RepID=A0ABQ0IP48_9ACTN|nr:hypothetical protein [Gordonia paraffinivorans]MBY4572641.1 hypothetical protein [Gordonia paraffinivorans]GAC85332.1 hypothetical protein GP2_033_00670 [Gordonia paraffinivorans NBRC 108238]
MVKTTGFTIPGPAGITVRQFATLLNSEEHGQVEIFTRIEIGAASGRRGVRRMFQRTSSCPIIPDVEHPGLPDLPDSAFVGD